MYKILLVDNDAEIFTMLNDYNKNFQKYELIYIPSSKRLLEILNSTKIDLILMDWDLETECGLDLIKDLKKTDSFKDIPMALLTARVELTDQIQGLDGGADDYISKPCSLKFLFSKINALLRKEDKDKNTQIQFKDKFVFKEEALEVEHSGFIHKMSRKEFFILKTLVSDPSKVFSQKELNDITSGKDVHVSKRSVDTFVTNIRNKIGKESILSIRTKGYKINQKLIE